MGPLELTNSKGAIGIFLKEPCYGHLSQHQIEDNAFFHLRLPQDLENRSVPGPLSSSTLAVQSLFDFQFYLAIKPAWAPKSSDNLRKKSYISQCFFLWVDSPHLVLQMDLNKKSFWHRFQWSQRNQRNGTQGNILFFVVFLKMDFTCVNVLTINLSAVNSCGWSRVRPTLLPLFRCTPFTCAWNGGHADPLWSPSAFTQNFKHKQWKTEPTQHIQKTICSADD